MLLVYSTDITFGFASWQCWKLFLGVVFIIYSSRWQQQQLRFRINYSLLFLWSIQFTYHSHSTAYNYALHWHSNSAIQLAKLGLVDNVLVQILQMNFSNMRLVFTFSHAKIFFYFLWLYERTYLGPWLLPSHNGPWTLFFFFFPFRTLLRRKHLLAYH